MNRREDWCAERVLLRGQTWNPDYESMTFRSTTETLRPYLSLM